MNIDESHGEGNQLKTEVLKWEFSDLRWEREKDTSPKISLCLILLLLLPCILLSLKLSVVQEFPVQVFCAVHIGPFYLTEHVNNPFGYM